MVRYIQRVLILIELKTKEKTYINNTRKRYLQFKLENENSMKM